MKSVAFALLVASLHLSGEAGTFTLDWAPNAEPDLATYEVWYGTDPDDLTEMIRVGLETSVTVTGLQPGRVYHFNVTACNTSGLRSEPSDTVYYEVPVEPMADLPREDWQWAQADSEESVEYGAAMAIDGDPDTFWHSSWSTGDELPHELRIDLGGVFPVAGIRYLPRQDELRVGEVGGYEIYLSADGESWGAAVAAGTFEFTKEEKEVYFEKQEARYLRFVALSDWSGKRYTSVAELAVMVAEDDIVAGNQAPVVGDESVKAVEDVMVAIELPAYDPDGDELVYEVTGAPAHGSLSGVAPELTYTPDPDFHGTDAFEFRAHDGSLSSGIAVVTIEVAAVNDRPVVAAGELETAEDTPVELILSGDDPDGDKLTYSVIGLPEFGILMGTPPNLVYHPYPNFEGTDRVSFLARDASSASEVAVVEIAVSGVNDAPVPADAKLVTAEDVAVPVVLEADDPEGDPVEYVVATPPSHGALSGTPPALTYVPGPDFNGSDWFTFSANDGREVSGVGTVFIEVTPVNDTPVAVGGVVETTKNMPVEIELVGTDPDGDELTVSVVGMPEYGRLSGTPPKLTYTPSWKYLGEDEIVFLVGDGQARSEVAVVEIRVTEANEPPVASHGSVTTAGGTPVSFELKGSDPEGEELVFSLVSEPENGTLEGTPPYLSYTPDAGFAGEDSFAFVANDGVSDSEEATISIVVTASEDDAPLISREGWTVAYVDSEDAADYPAAHAIDGFPGTFWHTRWDSAATMPPHEIRIDLGGVHEIEGFGYLPRQDGSSVGRVGEYEFYVSEDGKTWETPVASGVFEDTMEETIVTFPAVTGRYIRFRALTEIHGFMHTSMAELTLMGVKAEGSESGLEAPSKSEGEKVAATRPVLTPPSSTPVASTVVSKPESKDGSYSTTPPVVVSENQAPRFVSAKLTRMDAVESEEYRNESIADAASDPDAGDTLTFSKVDGPEWLVVADDGSLSGTPASGDSGLHEFKVRVSDTSGAMDEAVLSVSVCRPGVPLPWSVKQLGGGSLETPALYCGEDITVRGVGRLEGREDGGTFVWKLMRGNGRISARVQDLSVPEEGGMAGVMIRDSLAANAMHSFLGVDGSGSLVWMRRNATAKGLLSDTMGPASEPEAWIRLERNSGVITAYRSADGQTWEKIASSNLRLGRSVYIGLMSGGSEETAGEAKFGGVEGGS